ncbi:MAG: hypothetical protein ACI9X0_002098 [Kiritimatiellia bacterium]
MGFFSGIEYLDLTPKHPVTRDGYESLHLTNFVSGSSGELTNDLGTIMLTPVDVNTNGMGEWRDDGSSSSTGRFYSIRVNLP